jgi:hypothetical protein
MKPKPKLPKPLPQFNQEPFGLLTILKPNNEVSNAEELPLYVLSEPGVNLSAHRAPIIQPPV